MHFCGFAWTEITIINIFFSNFTLGDSEIDWGRERGENPPFTDFFPLMPTKDALKKDSKGVRNQFLRAITEVCQGHFKTHPL